MPCAQLGEVNLSLGHHLYKNYLSSSSSQEQIGRCRNTYDTLAHSCPLLEDNNIQVMLTSMKEPSQIQHQRQVMRIPQHLKPNTTRVGSHIQPSVVVRTRIQCREIKRCTHLRVLNGTRIHGTRGKQLKPTPTRCQPPLFVTTTSFISSPKELNNANCFPPPHMFSSC